MKTIFYTLCAALFFLAGAAVGIHYATPERQAYVDNTAEAVAAKAKNTAVTVGTAIGTTVQNAYDAAKQRWNSKPN